MSAQGLLFSGQGAQQVGMGKSLSEAIPLVNSYWDKANEVLGFDLKGITFEGPEAKLTETSICQPALYVHGYSIYKALEEAGRLKDVKVALGLSLGELTALAAAEVFDFETGLKIVAKRGALMQEACEHSEGGMLCIIGGEPEAVESLCTQFDIDMANFNSPGQIVISGDKSKVNEAAEFAKESGFKRVIPLNVAGAYHSRLMQPAADAFEAFLKNIPFNTPKMKVFTNVTGGMVEKPEEIKAALIKQVVSSVLWVDCMENAAKEGVSEFYECGPGKVLKGLARRMNPDWEVHSISEYADLEALKASVWL